MEEPTEVVFAVSVLPGLTVRVTRCWGVDLFEIEDFEEKVLILSERDSLLLCQALKQAWRNAKRR